MTRTPPQCHIRVPERYTLPAMAAFPPGRLRARPIGQNFHVVLVEPEIPPNTGNIARLCAATGAHLHLVGRLGFSVDQKAVRRAGLDYWDEVSLETHESLTAVETTLGTRYPSAHSWLLSGRATRSYLDVSFEMGDVLVFGKESTGLDPELLARREDAVIGIPTLGAVRSLNLANSVAIVLYEALRQVGALTPCSDTRRALV